MPALPLPLRGRKEEGEGAGAFLDWETPRPLVNETKALIAAVMAEFGRPVASAELYAIWNGTKSLQAIEYHLSTLVKANVAELVFGEAELRFQLVPEDETESVCRERCR